MQLPSISAGVQLVLDHVKTFFGCRENLCFVVDCCRPERNAIQLPTLVGSSGVDDEAVGYWDINRALLDHLNLPSCGGTVLGLLEPKIVLTDVNVMFALSTGNFFGETLRDDTRPRRDEYPSSPMHVEVNEMKHNQYKKVLYKALFKYRRDLQKGWKWQDFMRLV